ncbi:MAG TPA: VWA domain-containing protein [Bryobacteraceae bacterium]|nr:VWA domain-containing protein [Bryobacteraceae bacterium]
MIALRRLSAKGKAGAHFVFLILWAATINAAQTATQKTGANQEGAPSVTIRANVREVLVPVVVTDKKGHYITDLKPTDFQVYEDGASQKVVAFSSAPDTMVLRPDGTTVTHVEPAVPPGFEPKTPNTTPQRTYLICVDTLHSAFANFARVRQALHKFFEQERGGDSQYALMALGRNLTVVRDSTRNPSDILAAVDDKQFLKTIQNSEASGIGMEMQRFNEAMGRYCALCGCGAGWLVQVKPGCAGAKADVQASLLRFGTRTLILNQTFLRSLEKLVGAMTGMPTTRTIVFISDGFNRQPGNELYNTLQAASPGDKSFEFNPLDTQDLLNKVVRLAVANDVRFYTLDSRGLYTLGSLPGSGWDASSWGGPSETIDRAMMVTARQNTDGLAELARETGGLFFESNNDLLKGIQRAFADGRQHYVLAYVPSNNALDGSYRKIQVEVKRPNVHVNAKPGYWAPKK